MRLLITIKLYNNKRELLITPSKLNQVYELIGSEPGMKFGGQLLKKITLFYSRKITTKKTIIVNNKEL